jgi:ABC-type multidrug transport system ATPase subunit
METVSAIVFEGVTRRFGRLTAVDELSFEVRAGDVFGFIGPNGAGKTTSIKMMVGLLRPHGGALRVDGKPMPKAQRSVHQVTGYLSQHTAFQPWRTVHHVLATFGRLSGLDRASLPGRIETVLDQVGLARAQAKRAVHLSGGQARRLGLAQAILHRPRILILDEPLAGLDPANRAAVKHIIQELVSTGVTVLFSSHILSDVQDIATRVGIINRGKLVRAGTLAELRAEFSVGRDIRVELSTDNGRWRELDIPGLSALERPRDGLLRARTDGAVDEDTTIDRLIRGLLAVDCRIRSVQPVMPSLDDIYFRLLEEDGGAAEGGRP